MKRIYWIIFLLLFVEINYAQTNLSSKDNKYLEDQIYISLTYNLLLNKPPLINQNGFSGGVSFGFIKDLPINKKRTFGFGLGVGYSYNALIQNLKISQLNGTTVFEEAVDYSSNKLSLKSIDIPVEIRWRNSTPSKFKFWRIYSGVKFSYITTAKSKYRDSNDYIVTKNISEINRLQYGITLAAGYGTWNLFMYYALNPIFNNANLNNEKVNFKQLNVGLKFYIM
ncbi:MAG: porin family protein [Lutibacter sp.]|uniref:porin family protein n=1 Tax=Lutibacter sp. TaxID=1925666 RepID=UPI00299E11B5|nr:porin family protein [Lutibacter sp.]MDX1829461.1 porin family protein [Lutibacter sp.]